jgi:hypothetical protein
MTVTWVFCNTHLAVSGRRKLDRPGRLSRSCHRINVIDYISIRSKRSGGSDRNRFLSSGPPRRPALNRAQDRHGDVRTVRLQPHSELKRYRRGPASDQFGGVAGVAGADFEHDVSQAVECAPAVLDEFADGASGLGYRGLPSHA